MNLFCSRSQKHFITFPELYISQALLLYVHSLLWHLFIWIYVKKTKLKKYGSCLGRRLHSARRGRFRKISAGQWRSPCRHHRFKGKLLVTHRPISELFSEKGILYQSRFFCCCCCCCCFCHFYHCCCCCWFICHYGEWFSFP